MGACEHLDEGRRHLVASEAGDDRGVGLGVEPAESLTQGHRFFAGEAEPGQVATECDP